LTDELGRYVLYFPYPEALPPLTGSPPTGSQPTWPVTLWVRYQPGAQHQLADALPSDPPELGSLLSQASASIAVGGGTQTNLAATLFFGTQLLVMLEVVPA
jgi:hypothetical protein